MAGKVFVVLPPTTKSDSVIYGRISFENCQEIIYFPSSTAQPNKIKLENLEIESKDTYGLILSKSKDTWGGLSGSNEKNVTIGLVYKNNETGILGNELLRLALERSKDAEETIDTIDKLLQEFGPKDVGESAPTFSFVICDSQAAWILNIVGKLWAAEKITQFRCVGSGLVIETQIDKSTEDLKEKCKSLNLWDGSNEFNFKEVFNSNNQQSLSSSWDATKPEGENTFVVQEMFDVLRSLNDDNAKSSHVSVLNSNRNSVNWFTGTSTKESVFKPFVFTPGARISPLTKTKDGDEDTQLNKLHSNRKWEVVGSLLQSLEKTCVDEVNSFLSENPGTPNQELDDLMKDCVEAEVKFYR